MKYSEELTLSCLNSSLSKVNPCEVIIFLDQMLDKEDDSKVYSVLVDKNISVLDMDILESCCAKYYQRRRHKSVDLAFIVTNGIESNTVLAELRLNYTNPNHLKLKDLKEKVKTSSRQSKLFGYALYDKIYFVFSDEVKEQAKYRLSKMIPKAPSYYKAETVSGIYLQFFVANPQESMSE